VACEPTTDYLRWEAEVLRLRAEYGEQIRVIALNEHPPPSEFPEFVILGDSALYTIEYDRGSLSGARAYSDRTLIAACRESFDALFAEAEEFAGWYARTIR